MSTYTLQCQCGEQFHVARESVGRRIKCRRCGKMIEVRQQQRERQHTTKPAAHRTAWRAIDTAVLSFASTLWRTLRTIFRRMPGTVAESRRHVQSATPRVRALILLSWGYLIAVCAITAFIWLFGDSWWPATVILFIGRWIFLLPLVVLLPAVLLAPVTRRLVGPLLIGALIAVGPLMGGRLGWRAWLPHPAGSHVRVVTFNADDGDPIAPILPEVVTGWDADIVALQECGTQLSQVAQHISGWSYHKHRGLCLLSRYPIRAVAILDRSTFERINEDESSGIGGSADVVRYTLETPHGLIDVTNLHLETPRKGLEGLASGAESFNTRRLRLNTELRDLESQVARGWVEQGRSPRLVMGDFNMPVESRIFQSHWSGLVDAFSYAGFGFGMSKYNGWIRVRIDHVLSDAAWRADHVTIGQDLGSDHRPVIVDLTLKTRP